MRKMELRNKLMSVKDTLDDSTFFEELRDLRGKYEIRPAQISSDLNRRRIARVVIEAFLRYHPLQKVLSVNEFQMLAVVIEMAMYLKLRELSLICEPIDEEIRLEEEGRVEGKVGKRKMTESEARQFALKLSCQDLLATEERTEDFLDCRDFVDKIIQILEGGENGRREKGAVSDAISRPVDDITDLDGSATL